MPPSAHSRTSPPAAARTRRGGRPTREEAARLDRAVRDCALRLFLEHGYEGTSMDAIARAAGTTKATLYKRFTSKEDVFSSVLEWAIMRSDWPRPEPEPPDLDDLEGALTAIAETALRRALDPAMVQLGRIAVTQAARFPEIARRTHAAGFFPRQPLVAELLRRHATTGAIVADDPEILAEHFLGMVAGMPARLASFGIVRDPDVQERHTRAAVRLFLRSLRPD
ncbi:DNA-binding transcriptional regulator, AcrR family [Thermomonospora echinospora]|uniref:DNA-binding transcriptional regulator, AcrR family n=1 Tax=Thermomonospora echinospora TaxID=1992 RepID=A0A1H6DIM5_9ACTN|nr:TetR/AcrR family transcriptional regulator [Thermomonospora echinospora]SEG85064.1 DNA-binding transcriptional regulator, AcrR family [Thermomonospora echinospora]